MDESESGPTSRDEMMHQLAEMMTDKSIGKKLTEVRPTVYNCLSAVDSFHNN